jgi:hypothetical protein
MVQMTHDVVQTQSIDPLATDFAFLEMHRRGWERKIGSTICIHEVDLRIGSPISPKSYGGKSDLCPSPVKPRYRSIKKPEAAPPELFFGHSFV